MYSNVSSQDPLYESLWSHSASGAAGSGAVSTGNHEVNKDGTSASAQRDTQYDLESLASEASAEIVQPPNRYMCSIALEVIEGLQRISKLEGEKTLAHWFSSAVSLRVD